MRLISVKPSVIIGIALLVTLLGVFRRLMSLVMGTHTISDTYVPISIHDITTRAFFIFIFSVLILQFNINWKYIFSKYPLITKRAISICINLFISIVIVKLLFVVYPIITDVQLPKEEKNRFWFGYVVMYIILFFIAGFLRYQKVSQKQEIENEQLKQQSLENELVALKNQINPHFLFNSLNSLNSLIRENKTATMFVNKLSFMYRYILQSSDRNVVSLKEELKFLDSYIFLIKTRYRNRFDIHIHIDKKLYEENVPPLALQLLVENAVKHNEISESNPLLVKVYVDNGYICVENKILLRTTFVDSTGNGLSNLNKRCLLLKDREIEISDVDGVFKVKFLLK